MFGINNIKDFLESLAYIVAIVLGIQEILNSRKGKQFPSYQYYYILHRENIIYTCILRFFINTNIF